MGAEGAPQGKRGIVALIAQVAGRARRLPLHSGVDREEPPPPVSHYKHLKFNTAQRRKAN
jgi:hypothetical protein